MNETRTLDEAGALLRALRDDLKEWHLRLQPIASGIQGAAWEKETDAPHNAAARMQGTVDGLLREDLPELLRQIETALDASARSTDERL